MKAAAGGHLEVVAKLAELGVDADCICQVGLLTNLISRPQNISLVYIRMHGPLRRLK